MAASLASSSSTCRTHLNSSRPLHREPYPLSHLPSNPLKFTFYPSSSIARATNRTSSSISCSLTRDPPSVLSMEVLKKDSNGSVLFQRPDSFGRFGRFGGKYVPETLMCALTELEAAFHSLVADEDFQVLISVSI